MVSVNVKHHVKLLTNIRKVIQANPRTESLRGNSVLGHFKNAIQLGHKHIIRITQTGSYLANHNQANICNKSDFDSVRLTVNDGCVSPQQYTIRRCSVISDMALSRFHVHSHSETRLIILSRSNDVSERCIRHTGGHKY